MKTFFTSIILCLLLAMTGCGKKDPFLVSTSQNEEEGQNTESEAIGEQSSESSVQYARDVSKTSLDNVIYFVFGSSSLTQSAQDVLKVQAEETIKFNATILVAGHCDARGPKDFNIALGYRRAEAVRDYLVSQGVNPSVIKVISFGKEKLADIRDTEEAHAINRRVEIQAVQSDVNP